MFIKITLATVFSAMVATQAAAAPNPTDACATGLKPESRLIFDDVAPLLPTTQPLQALLREHTIALVMGGKLGSWAASWIGPLPANRPWRPLPA
jgi:hypothetical protein